MEGVLPTNCTTAVLHPRLPYFSTKNRKTGLPVQSTTRARVAPRCGVLLTGRGTILAPFCYCLITMITGGEAV